MRKKTINNELALLKIANYERIIFYRLLGKACLFEEVANAIDSTEKGLINKDFIVTKDYDTFAPAFERLYSQLTAIKKEKVVNLPALKERQAAVDALRHDIICLLANASINKTFVSKLIDKLFFIGQPVMRVYPLQQVIKGLKDRLVEDNRYLVVNIAQSLHVKDGLEDIVNYGTQGIIKAVNLFEPCRKLKFSTYAYYWIQVYTREAILSSGHVIKIPIYLQKKMRHLNKVYSQLLIEKGRPPTSKELSRLTGVSEASLHEIERVKSMQFVSIHQPVNENHELGDLLVAPQKDANEIEFVHRGLSQLPALQASVIKELYGIGLESAVTMKSVCRKYNITRKECMEIKNNGIQLLKQALS